MIDITDRTNGVERGFHHYSEAWYCCPLGLSDGEIDRITLGYYAPGGGTSGEFSIVWRALGSKPVPCIQMFDDSWWILAEYPKLFAELAARDEDTTSPADMCTILKRHGFKDMTARERKS